MRISDFGAEALPADVLQRALAFLSYKNQNFAAQLEFLGLDPANDFRHSDLSGVDFSNCDLRGFDFTDADLRDSIGVNVLWDSSTIFTNADARGSLFSYSIEKSKYFETHPEDLETVRRLTSELWTNTILGVESLLQSDKGKGSSIRIAHAVFDETASSVVRSNVLAFMRIASDSSADHKSFIFNIFARFSDQPGTVIAGLRTLSAFYKDDIDVFSWLKAFLQNPNQHMRREAFKGLLASKHFIRGIASLREYAINADSLTRRLFLGRIAHVSGPPFVLAASDTEVSNFLDFAQPISSRKLEEMASRTLHVMRLRERHASTSYNITKVGPVRIEEHEINQMAIDFKRALQILAKRYKIPFIFERTN